MLLTTSLQAPDNSQDQELKEATLFESGWYLLLYILAWNFLFEISLIIVIHFKQKAFYIAEHLSINFMVIAIQLVNNIVLFKSINYDFSSSFAKVEIVIFVVLLLQIIIGVLLNKKLESDNLVKGISILRLVHKSSGRIIYCAAKIQIAIFSYNYFATSSMPPFVFISLLFGLTLTTHVSLWVVFKNHVIDNFEITDFLVNSSPKSVEYSDLLRNIESGDIEVNPQINLMSEHHTNLNLNDVNSELFQQKSEISWVIIEDKVFDITGLRHPKGNYILKAIQFKDITREIFGLKEWRFSGNGESKVSMHRHVARTFEFLKKHCIGEIEFNPVIVSRMNSNKLSVSGTNSSLDLFDNRVNMVDSVKFNRVNLWSLTYSHAISNDSSIIFVSKKEKDHLVNLSSFWLKNFGKYFFIKNAKGEEDYYYLTLSLSPKYLALRKAWQDQLNFSFLRNLGIQMLSSSNEVSQLSNDLMNKVGPGFEGLLDKYDEIRDPFIPLFHYRPSHGKKIIEDCQEYKINGPVGLGMGFDPNSTKKILIMARDAGILPFADFLEFLGQRSLIELNEMKNPHPIFGKEYLLYYINEISIWIYWEINDWFWADAQLLGLSGLEIVNSVSKEAKFTNRPSDQDRDFTKIVNIVEKAHLINSQGIRKDSKISQSSTNANNFQEVLNCVMGSDVKGINKILVSGEMTFVNRVLKDCNAPSDQIIIL